jgi:solute carrier family 25 carnitine/acylcarnitine transporter 20/29
MSPEPNPSRQSQHSHANLIEEAEQELSVLTWPELMTAGGLAGVIAWMVSSSANPMLVRN